MGAQIIESSTVISDSDRSYSDEECIVENGDNGEEVIFDVHRHELLVTSVTSLLAALGEDVSRNGLVKTPSRVARAMLAATKGYHLSSEQTIGGALFTEAAPGNGQGGGSGGIVVVRNNEFFSTCESCLLPFKVRCHIAYIPSGQRVVGLSKLPRVAEIFAERLQSPDRLVHEVAQSLTDGFQPLGVAVVAEHWHIQCGSLTGSSPEHSASGSAWVRGTVFARTGKFNDQNSEDWSEFLAMLSISGIRVCKKSVRCPLLATEHAKLPEAGGKVDVKGMVEAAACMLKALVEDPDREELKLTPARYVHWLIQSTQGNRLPLDVSSPGGAFVSSVAEEKTERVEAVLEVPFSSQCEHHLLPFTGVAHIGFSTRGSKKRYERSVFQNIVKLYSCRLQVQERLTKQIAERVMNLSDGVTGVVVVVEASHICMISRGVKKSGTSTATFATLGTFASDFKSRSEFFQTVAAAQERASNVFI